MFEDLNYEELKRRANARLPERVVATLEAHGERRSVAEGELLYGVDDRQYPSSTRFRPLSRYGILTDWCSGSWSRDNSPVN